ncbi:MAG: transporter substrate-binding domain-containing protein [Pseudonocardiaceae bacterium]
MSTRFALASSVLVAVLLAASAADQPGGQPATTPAPAARQPTTVAHPSETPVPGSQPATPCSDPVASLRPQGPLPVPGRMPAGSAMADIAERGQLRVAVGPDTYLISSRNSESGQLEGFDIDIAGDIAEAIFGDRRRVMYRQLDLPGRLRAAERGEVDLVVSTTTITCSRRAQVEFSTVYLQARQRVLVNRGSDVTDLDSLAGKRICAARGSTSLQKVLVTPSGPIPVGVPGVTDCLVMLQLGEVDAVSTEDTLLAGLAAQDPRTEIVGAPLNDEPYGVAINPAAPDLVRFVNAVLARRIQDGRWRASYQRWLEAALGPPPAPPQPRYQD